MDHLPKPQVALKSGSTTTAFTGVRLRLHKMVCVDETDGLLGNEMGNGTFS